MLLTSTKSHSRFVSKENKMISRYTNHGTLKGIIGYNSAVTKSQEAQDESVVVTSKVGDTTAEVQEPKDGYCSDTSRKGEVCARVELNVQEMTRARRKFRSVKGKVASVDVSVFEKHQPDGSGLLKAKSANPISKLSFSRKTANLVSADEFGLNNPLPFPLPKHSGAI